MEITSASLAVALLTLPLSIGVVLARGGYPRVLDRVSAFTRPRRRMVLVPVTRRTRSQR